MLSNSPGNYAELQEIERTDRANPQPAKAFIMKPYTRRYLILQFWHQGRSIEGIALELAAHGYDNNTPRSIARALRDARYNGYKVSPALWQEPTDPLATMRADLGKFERPAIPDGAAPLLGYESFGIFTDLADLPDPRQGDWPELIGTIYGFVSLPTREAA